MMCGQFSSYPVATEVPSTVWVCVCVYASVAWPSVCV